MIDRSGWKIIMPANSKKWELYNLNIDRSEMHDLANKYPKKVQEMEHRYQQWENRCLVVPRP